METAEEKAAAKKVLLLHGIWSSGGWYKNIRPVLDPHFTVVPVRYGQYRWYGALAVVCEPRYLIPACFAGFAGWYLDISYWPQIAAIALVIFFLSFHPRIVKGRQDAATDTVFSGMEPHILGTPHLIAHSFGTFLTIKLFENYKGNTNFDRIVFAGCVLPRDMPWIDKRQSSFLSHVLNNFSEKDWVARAAGVAGRLHKGIGDAGRFGFNLINDVHEYPALSEPCASCANGASAVVHNLRSERFPHRAAARARSHTIRFWLPFLWEIDLDEYELLRRFSTEYVTLSENRSVDSAETELGSVMTEKLHAFQAIDWNWAGGKVQDPFLRICTSNHLVADDLDNFCHFFLLGMGTAFREEFPALPNRLKNLHPRNALTYARDKYAKDKAVPSNHVT